jgi:DNA recombination protein RmuC
MLIPSLLLIFGLAAGALIAWLILRAKVATLEERIVGKDSELDEIRNSRDQVCSENERLRGDVRTEQERRSHAEVNAARASDFESQSRELEMRAEALQAEIVSLNSRLAESKAKLPVIEEARTEFITHFENLANKILEDKTKRFTEQNKLNLDLLLQPLGVQIKEFKERIEQVYDSEAQQRVSLRNEIGLLRALNEKMDQDAINLTNALRGQSKTLGNWGEGLLEEILQKAGLTKDREYIVRETFTGPDGKRSQPDVVIVLPEGRHLIIDSKINLAAYLRYSSAEDDAECRAELKKHINGVRTHLRELDFKAYQDHHKLNSLDFVLMFVPLEPAFIVAVRQDVTLFDDAFAKRVVIVCPSTLLATMRTVRNIWRQEQQKQNVLEIANQSGALYDKFVGFVEDLKEIGVRLRQAQQSYDAAHNKLTSGKGNLVSKAERILQLGAKASKRLQQNLISDADDNDLSENISASEEPKDSAEDNPGGLLPASETRVVEAQDNADAPLFSSRSASGQS